MTTLVIALLLGALAIAALAAQALQALEPLRAGPS